MILPLSATRYLCYKLLKVAARTTETCTRQGWGREANHTAVEHACTHSHMYTTIICSNEIRFEQITKFTYIFT